MASIYPFLGTGTLADNLSERTKDFTLDIARRAKSALEQTKSRAGESMGDFARRFEKIETEAFQEISFTAEKAKEKFNHAIDASVERGNRATERILNSIDENAKNAAEIFNNFVARHIEPTLRSPIDNWISHHPIAGWFINHPVISFAIFLLSLFLAWGLLKALAKLAEIIGLKILSLPLLLGRFIFGSSKQQSLEGTGNTINSEQFKTIIEKLETIEKEQRLILQELAELKNAKQ